MKHVVALPMNLLNPYNRPVDLTLLPIAISQYLVFCQEMLKDKTNPDDEGDVWSMLMNYFIQDSYLKMIKHTRFHVFTENGTPTQASFFEFYKTLIELIDGAYRYQIHFILAGIDRLGKITETAYLTHNSHQILFEVTYVHLLPHLKNPGQ